MSAPFYDIGPNGVTVRYNHLPEIRKQFPDQIMAVLKEGADKIRERGNLEAPEVVRNTSRVKASKNGFQVTWGPFWASFVEYGTVYQKANPFVTPAAEAIFPRIQSEIKRLGRNLK